MNIAICDDEKQFIEDIKKHLDFYSNDNNIDFDIYTFSSGVDLIKSNIRFNIAILDVEMPNVDGLELGKKLREINKHIVLIYVTAHKKYLDEALNLNAARFFEKPIDSQRFYDGLDNAIKRIDNTTINFFLKDNTTSIRVNADDIIYIEIEQIGHRKTKVVTENNIYISSNKISFWEENLISTVFVKSHKSYIVNLNYITKCDRDCLELDHKYTVPISRNYQSSFHKNFVRFMAGV
jgi:two-component system LytT family response regulator